MIQNASSQLTSCVWCILPLIPGYKEISINDQRSIFSLRNRRVQIYENFPSMNEKELCRCENEETMKHIYDCEYFCEHKYIEKPNFEDIFKENVRQQIIISRIFEKNCEIRNRRKEEDKLGLSCAKLSQS